MSQNDEHIPERRESPRIETDFDGRLDAEQNVHCRVVNISRSGARAVSTVALPEFSEVEISLNLKFDDETHALRCRAAVVRCDPREDGHFDVGLFFPALEPEQKALLLRAADRGQFTPIS